MALEVQNNDPLKKKILPKKLVTMFAHCIVRIAPYLLANQTYMKVLARIPNGREKELLQSANRFYGCFCLIRASRCPFSEKFGQSLLSLQWTIWWWVCRGAELELSPAFPYNCRVPIYMTEKKSATHRKAKLI